MAARWGRLRIPAFLRTGSAIVIGESIIVSLLGFATFTVMVRSTSLDVVGVWVLVSSLIGFSRIADFWTKGLTSFVAEARGNGNERAAVGYIATAALTGAIGYALAGAIAAPIIYVFADQLVGAAHAPILHTILPLMFAIYWISAMATLYQLGFLGFQRPIWKAVQSIGGNVIFLIGAILLAPRLGLMGILYAQLIQGIAMLVFAVLVFHLHVAPTLPDRWWDRVRFANLAGFGSKALVIGMLVLGIEPAIRLLVSTFGGLSQVTVVELASRLLAAVRNVVSSLGQILIPSFARLIDDDGPRRAELYGKVQTIFGETAWPAMALLFAASPLAAMTVIGHPEPMLGWYNALLGIGWATNLIASPAFFLLMGSRRLRAIFVTHCIMTLGALSIGGTAGAVGGVVAAVAGAAIALLLSSLFMAHAARRTYGIAGTVFSDMSLTPHTIAPAFVGFVTLGVYEAVDPFTGIWALALLVVPTILTALFCVPIRHLLALSVELEHA